jgi:AraC family transcriptional activator FtrA
VVPLHRGGSQAQYVPRPVASDSRSRLSPVFDWIRASLAKDLSIATLSRRANMSPRTFIRHFTMTTGMAPGEWILNERLALARDLLETSIAPIDDVARTCGLGSAATLRHHFRRRLNTTPTAHRLHFHSGYPEIVARAAAEQRVAIRSASLSATLSREPRAI